MNPGGHDLWGKEEMLGISLDCRGAKVGMLAKQVKFFVMPKQWVRVMELTIQGVLVELQVQEVWGNEEIWTC